ncbi:hypothetical protein BLA29_000746 [Euroglyphus maynei]|uniref:Alphavirus-like MT domain-containing protein n=1 Tax=Euroglyphus maynei TaxID=6958 RepID=A0A1Y3BTZ3_EURMA|nr:hypothetical protein BLA29_000746 [Euroglyphus maynei]
MSCRMLVIVYLKPSVLETQLHNSLSNQVPDKTRDVLSKSFPNFNLVYDKLGEFHTHPFAACERYLFYLECVNEFGTKSYDKKLGYDTLIVTCWWLTRADRFLQAVVNEKKNLIKLHCRTSLTVEKRSSLQHRIKRTTVAENFLSNTNRCNSKAQFCSVRAPYIIFAHSSYDMTINDIANIMDCANAIAWVVYLLRRSYV